MKRKYHFDASFRHWHWKMCRNDNAAGNGNPSKWHFCFSEGFENGAHHYSDVIMSAMASQITGVTICLLNRLFRRRSNKTSKLCVTGICAGNSPATGEFLAQRASNAEIVSIWRRHHDSTLVLWSVLEETYLIVGCGISRFEPEYNSRIVGGEEAIPNAFPWQVSVL